MTIYYIEGEKILKTTLISKIPAIVTIEEGERKGETVTLDDDMISRHLDNGSFYISCL